MAHRRRTCAGQIRTQRRPAASNSDTSHDANYDAPNYDALVDAPVEIGQFDEWNFAGGGAAAGRTIRVVYHGETVDHDALTRMLSQIVNYETGMMVRRALF